MTATGFGARPPAVVDGADYLISAEATLDAVIVTDNVFCIVYANPSAAALFGCAREELVGEPLARFLPDGPRHAPRTGAHSEGGDDSEGGDGEASGEDAAEAGLRGPVLELPGVRRDGTRFLAEVVFSERYAGGVRRLSAVLRDVSERGQTRAALQKTHHSLAVRVEEHTSELTAELERTRAELERVRAQLFYGTFHDRLTGLANRALLLDRLRLLLEPGGGRGEGAGRDFAVLYLDLDRFKVVNDTLGHDAGDRLLGEIGARLSRLLRPEDLAARIAGDEFALLLGGPVTEEHAAALAGRIQDELGKPFVLGAQTLYMGVSIGVVLGGAGSGSAAQTLRDAEIAMRHARTLGGGRYGVFTEALREQALGLLALEADLRGAAAGQQLAVYYQPIVSLTAGQPVGFEALLRWHHPTLGPVAPADFVPVAEETGLIVGFDRWVLRQACAQLRRWQGLLPAPFSLNVNLSSQQFARADLVPFVAAALRDHGVAAAQLGLEVTESALMQADAAVAVNVERLRALGVRIYVDDFGTGYSSLAYLQRFTVDSLKIDAAFVSDVTTNAKSSELIKTILAMARALGLQVVAEGIETRAQLEHLKGLGCPFGQGYLFAQPLAEAEATTFLEGLKQP